jgi:CheY-like chemotaxis protein
MDRLMAGEDFDIVLCDLVIPGMSGMDCFEDLLRRRPEMATRMIFLTGGAFTPRARQFLEDNPGRWLEKPFAPEALRQRIGEALARTALSDTRPMGAGALNGGGTLPV